MADLMVMGEMTFGWIELGDGRKVYRRIEEKPRGPRGDYSCPMLNLDTMEPVQSMLDGKVYDSKAALRATYKQAGVVEVGNDSSVKEPKRKAPEPPPREEIKAAVGKAFSQAGLGA